MSAPLTPGSPVWWVVTLHKKLSAREKATKIFDDYYEGEHRLAFATSKFRQAFGNLFTEMADNWCELVVDAVEERLDVQGFRFLGGADADMDAWRIWQRNYLDSLSQQATLEALIHGEASAIVWGGERGATITVEHPHQVYVATDSSSPLLRRAALKVWTDEWTGDEFATLYLPDALYKFKRQNKAYVSLAGDKSAGWVPREVDGEPWPVPNPLGVVPVVPIVNRPRLLKPGRSEIKQVIPVQDAVNKLIADMLVASEYQAFRQRWATGLELPVTEDDEGNEITDEAALFKHSISRLWTTEDPDAKFGDFGQVDLAPFVEGVEMLVQHIASQSKTPPHYFYLSGQFPSGETIRSAEAGLASKAKRKQRFMGESWEEVMRLAFAVEGDPRANDMECETIWNDPETRTESAHVDAVIKKSQVGVPEPQLWEEMGYTPTQVERFGDMRRSRLNEETGLAAEFARILDTAPPAPPEQ